MRIIAGNFKGKKLLEPKDRQTRPLKDLTKESIFNVIKHSNLINVDIEKSCILDLFSGVGSFGLECISRGALSVIFFENYAGVLSILKKNIISLNCSDNTNIFEEDAFSEINLKKFNKIFDIIFLDPPFKEKKVSELLKIIIKLDILKKDGIIIIHRNKKEKNNFPTKFNVIDERNYGISKIIFGNII
jgi:16S rRNA (guanine966-N2)-methyltransferase